MTRPARPSICYLCGELGADSKDHVPPKCLLPRGGHRVTLWAHAECNRSSSLDEEYVRDLIGPNASQYEGGQDTEAATWRSWSTPVGDRRRRMFLKNARLVELRSPAGLVLGRGWDIKYDRTRVANVGLKIARGVIFMDSGAIARPDDLRCIPIDSAVVPAERARETAKGNPFWLALCDPNAYHELRSCRGGAPRVLHRGDRTCDHLFSELAGHVLWVQLCRGRNDSNAEPTTSLQNVRLE